MRWQLRFAALQCLLPKNVAASLITKTKARRKLKHVKKKSKHRQSLYSIEFGPSIDTIRSRSDTILDYDDDHLHDRDGGELSPKPMTPRRVKRRSVMARGTNSRQSTTSRRSHHTGTSSRSKGSSGGGGDSSSGTYGRGSMRTSRRKYQQNPVTKLLDQQQQQLQQHHINHHMHTNKQQFGSFHHKNNPTLTATNLQTLNNDIVSNSNNNSNSNNIISSGSLTKTNNNHYHSFRKNIPPDPIYYNTNGQAGLYQQAWQSRSQNTIAADEPNSPTLTLTPTLAGHYNPTYQYSTTNLNDAVEHNDELYNNRPPSVRSSYSNFHGTRPLSTAYMPNAVTENVFAGLTGAQSQTHQPPCTPPLYQQHPIHQQQQQQQQQQQPQFQQEHQLQAVAVHPMNQQQLPLPLPSPNFSNTPTQNMSFTKRTASRESIRSMAFLNNGPPAYNLNYHTPPDSETTM